jgi:formylglycine-generating enzyme required for sulfatase activity
LPVIHQWITVAPGGKPKPVGKKAENAFGLQDMHGNVWEWCEDSYSDYEETSVIDPVPSDGVNRISRGGCWMSYAEFCRSAGRHLTVPYFDCPGIGFRVCLVPGPAAGLQSAGQGIGGRGTAKGEEF